MIKCYTTLNLKCQNLPTSLLHRFSWDCSFFYFTRQHINTTQFFLFLLFGWCLFSLLLYILFFTSLLLLCLLWCLTLYTFFLLCFSLIFLVRLVAGTGSWRSGAGLRAAVCAVLFLRFRLTVISFLTAIWFIILRVSKVLQF